MENRNNFNRNKNFNKNNYGRIDYNKELIKISKLDVNDGDILLVQMNDDSVKTSDIKRFVDMIPSRINKDVRIIVSAKDIELRTIDEKHLDTIINKLVDIRNSMEKGDKDETKNN